MKRWGNSAQTSFETVWQFFRWNDEEVRLRPVLKLSYNVFVEAMRELGGDKYWDCLRIYLLKRWGNSAQTSFETVWQFFRWNDEEVRLRPVLKLSYNVFVEAMREFGGDKYWDCLRFLSLKQWGNLVETSFEIVWQYFRWNDEEIRLRRVLKLSYIVFVEAMREFGWDKYWDCLRIYLLKRWWNSDQTSFETVWQIFRWNDEEIRLRRVLKLSYNVFVEAMREFGGDQYWDCLRIYLLKRWGNSAQTSFETVWQFFRWNDEEVRLRRVLKLSYNVFVEAMREFGGDKYWDCLRFLSLKQWGKLVETSFEIVWQYFRWNDEEIRLRRVLKLSYIVFVEAMREFGWDKYWDCLRIYLLKRWGNSAQTSFETFWQFFRWNDEEVRLRRVLKLSYNVSVEAMREFGWIKYWDCLRIYLLKRWGNSAQTSFETVWKYFRWSDEEIRLGRVLKLSYNVFVDAMRQFGWNKYWDCLRFFSLKWWRN